MRKPEQIDNCGDACFERRLRAWRFGARWREYLEDAIGTIVRTTVNWATDEPMPDTEILQRFPDADAELLEQIRGSLGGKRGTQEVEPLCHEECYCDIPSDAEPLHVNVVRLTLDAQYTYVTRRFLRPEGDSYLDPHSGEVVEVDPETDFLGEPRDILGRPMVDLFTRYTATVRFYRLPLERIELRGICRPLGEPDPSDPEHA